MNTFNPSRASSYALLVALFHLTSSGQNLPVNGNLTVTGDATVAGDTSVGGDLTVLGVADVDELRISGKSITQSLTSAKLMVRGGARYADGSSYRRRVIFNGQEPVMTKNDPNQPSTARGLSILLINRTDLSVISHIGYDCHGNSWAEAEAERTAMANALAALVDASSFVVIASSDAWGLNDALKTQLLRCGASPEAVNSGGKNASYVLVGIPGIGAGNGLEALNEVIISSTSPVGSSLVVDLVRPQDVGWDTSAAGRYYDIAGRKDNTFLKNDGSVAFHSDVAVKNRKVLRVSAAGDIPMIAGSVGTNPEL